MPQYQPLPSPPPLPPGAVAIDAAPGYAIFPDGTVISCRGIEVHYVMWKPWTPLRPIRLKAKKYPYVNIRINGKRKLTPLHRLVLTAFKGSPTSDNMQACHNDGNAENCSADNLRWDTPEANLEDKRKHGTIVRGEKVFGSKLTARDVREIRRLFQSGMTRNAIAKRFGVYFNSIHMIVTGKSWKHVK